MASIWDLMLNKKFMYFEKSINRFLMLLCLCFLTPGLSVAVANVLDTGTPGQMRYFEKNRGQFNDEALFASRGGNFHISFFKAKVQFNLYNSARGQWNSFEFVFNQDSLPEGEASLRGHLSVNLGREKSRWVDNVTLFSRLRYREVAPGVDVVFYFAGKNVEYDFIVAPGADLSGAQFQLRAGSSLELDDNGRLGFGLSDRKTFIKAPLSYQEVDGKRRIISSAYQISGNTVSFKLGHFDPTLALVIDPVIDYLTYWGGSGDESAKVLKLAPDGSGSYYVAGTTVSYSPFAAIGGGVLIDNGFLDSPSRSHGINECKQENMASGFSALTVSDYDAFVAKFSATHELEFASYFGGCGNDAVKDMEVKVIDGKTSIYVTGFTLSEDFPPVGAFQQRLSPQGNPQKLDSDAFVMHLGETVDGDGKAQVEILFSSYLGGDGIEGGRAIAVDDIGRIYVGGYSHSRVWPAAGPCEAPGVESVIQCKHSLVDEPRDPEDPFNTSSADGFIVQVGKGRLLNYVSFLGGSLDEWVADMLIMDDSGSDRLLIVGNTASEDFPVIGETATLRQLNKGDGACSRFIPARLTDAHACEDVFIIKTDLKAHSILSGTFFGGSNDETVTNVVLDSSGNPIISGVTQSTGLRVVNTGLIDLSGIDLDSLLGANQEPLSDAELHQFALDSFPLVNSLSDNIDDSIEANRSVDIFLTKFNKDLDSLHFSTFIRGSDREGVSDLQYKNNAIYLAGHTQSRDFPIAAGFQAIPVQGDGFIIKLVEDDSNQLSVAFSTLVGGEGSDFIDAIDIDSSDNIYFVGGTRSLSFPLQGNLLGTSLLKRQYEVRDVDSGAIVALETYSTDLVLGKMNLGASSADVDLGFTINSPQNITLGNQLEYRLESQNLGTEAAQDVRLYFEMPVAGFINKIITSDYPCTLLEYPEIDSTAPGYQQKLDNNFQFYCLLGELLPGEENKKTISFLVTANQSGTMRVFGGIYSQSFDEDQSNNGQTDNLSVRQPITRSSLSPTLMLMLLVFCFISVVQWRRFSTTAQP